VADDEQRDRARALTGRLDSQPPEALAGSRRLLREADPPDLKSLLNTETAAFCKPLARQEFQTVLAHKLGR